MEGFYDREVGVAWGPITKQEILDDIFIYGQKTTKGRKTLGCNPTFENKHRRYVEITGLKAKTTENFKLQEGESILLSSDEEEELIKYNYSSKNCVHEINCSKVNVDSIDATHLDVKDRLPTPAYLDEHTYDELSDCNEENNSSEHKSFIALKHDECHCSFQEKNNSSVSEYGCSSSVNHNEDNCNSQKESSLDQQEHVSITSDHDEGCCSFFEEKDFDQQENNHHLNTKDIIKEYQISSNNSEIGNENNLKSPHVKSDIEPNITNEFSSDNCDLFNDTLAEMERLLNQELNDSRDDCRVNKKIGNLSTNCYSPADASGETSFQITKAGIEKKELVYSSSKSSIHADMDNLSLNEESFPLSSILNDVPVQIIKSNSRAAIKSALPIYNKKLAINKVTAHTNVRSPLSTESTRSNIQTKSNLKCTLTPTNTKKEFTFSAPKTTSSRKRFKNIESPVAVYIKNAGVTPLFKKVTPSKPLSCEKIKTQATSSQNKENSLIFPEVVYKPAKRVLLTKEKEMKMPNKIEALIPHKPNVIRHEGRLGGNTRKDFRKKLLEDDITVDSSLNTSEDISIHYAKVAYIP